jgi:hypothetical protein
MYLFMYVHIYINGGGASEDEEGKKQQRKGEEGDGGLRVPSAVTVVVVPATIAVISFGRIPSEPNYMHKIYVNIYTCVCGRKEGREEGREGNWRRRKSAPRGLWLGWGREGGRWGLGRRRRRRKRKKKNGAKKKKKAPFFFTDLN